MAERDLPVAMAARWDGGSHHRLRLAGAGRTPAGVRIFRHRRHRRRPPQQRRHRRREFGPRGPRPLPGGDGVRRAPRRSWTCRTPSSASRRSACRSWATAATSCRPSGAAAVAWNCPSGVGTPAEAAAVVGAMGRTAVLFVVPPPRGGGRGQRRHRHSAINEALSRAEAAGITGGEVTPYVLDAIDEATAGRSVDANVELVVNNARCAAAIAAALTPVLTIPPPGALDVDLDVRAGLVDPPLGGRPGHHRLEPPPPLLARVARCQPPDGVQRPPEVMRPARPRLGAQRTQHVVAVAVGLDVEAVEIIRLQEAPLTGPQVDSHVHRVPPVRVPGTQGAPEEVSQNATLWRSPARTGRRPSRTDGNVQRGASRRRPGLAGPPLGNRAGGSQ